MKMRMCACRWSALARPLGPIKVEKTQMKSPTVLVARLSGAVNGQAAVVKHKKEFYFVPPKGYGETRKVAADYLTDGLHTAVQEMAFQKNIAKAAKKAEPKTKPAAKAVKAKAAKKR